MKRLSLILAIFCFCLSLVAAPVFAATESSDSAVRKLPDYTGTIKTDDAITDVQGRLAKALNTAFTALSVLALLPIAIGGVQLITSQGNSDQVERGKKTIFWGVTGLVIALAGVGVFTLLLRVLVNR